MGGKASLLTPAVVKQSKALIVKAPIQGGRVACALKSKLPEGFQQSNIKGQAREGGRRVCDQLVHSSLADGEVTGRLTL